MKMLPWLVDTPANFNERCKELPHSEDAIADALALASCELNLNQAYRLHRVIEKSERLRTSLAGKLEHFKLGIVSNGTLDLLLPMLAITALRRGVSQQGHPAAARRRRAVPAFAPGGAAHPRRGPGRAGEGCQARGRRAGHGRAARER